MKSATLHPVRMEITQPRNGRPGFVWIAAYEVISPEGTALQPYMRKAEAAAFCRAQGWTFEVKLKDYAAKFRADLSRELNDLTGGDFI